MSISDGELQSGLAGLWRPSNFFGAPPVELEWEPGVEETISWEVFRGRLLDANQTRQRHTFRSWHVFALQNGVRSGEPILSMKWDCAAGQVYVVRGLYCYVWEGYEAEDNVYLSREVPRWIRELVGTVSVSQVAQAELRQQLADRLFHAVVGLSRLPLTSPEAPLPGFSLGTFGYFYGPARSDPPAGPMRSAAELLEFGLSAELSWLEQVKLIELMLRAAAASDLPLLARQFAGRWQQIGHAAADLPRLLRALLNEVSLSPYTDFVPHLLRFVGLLVEQGSLRAGAQIDFLGHTLRQLGRHLTAYDLVTFHHRGANYPDALLLDAALREYLRLIEANPAAFLDRDAGGADAKKRLRRRALRQGWLLRRFYEGLPVPDAPVSPGENTRILPPPHMRVPEEQILLPEKRRRRLYADDPLECHLGPHGRHVLRASVADLRHDEELRELGMALFIDRPLGCGKSPGEPDDSLLFSHEAFSATVAGQRLDLLQRSSAGLLDAPWQQFHDALARLPALGMPANRYRGDAGRVVSLADASRVVNDFMLLRTTPAVVRQFRAYYRVAALERLFQEEALREDQVLILPEPAGAAKTADRLIIYDAAGQARVEVTLDRGA